jgi:hypothetical protein
MKAAPSLLSKTAMKRWLSFFIVYAVIFLGLKSFAQEFTPLSAEQIDLLKQQFNSAQPVAESQLGHLIDKPWKCQSFGVRSRQQTLKNDGLYSLKRTGATMMNTGIQPVKEYQILGQELRGNSEDIMDTLRLTEKGLLISEVSVKSSQLKKISAFRDIQSATHFDAYVIAYSLCN